MSETGRLKILVVTPWFPTVSSPGAGIFILRDVLTLAEHFEITVVHVGAPQFFDNFADELIWEEFRTVRAPFAFSDYRSLLRAVQCVRKELRQADYLHTMALGSLTPIVPLRVRKPWIHTEHWSGMLDEPVGTPRSQRVQRFLRRQLRRPDRVVAVSRILAQALGNWGAKDVQVIPNAVTLPPELPQEKPWDFSQLRMIFVGSLVETKGVMEALEALIELRHRGYDAKLTIIGSGPLKDALERLATDAGVLSQLHLTGQLSPKAVVSYLQDANIALMPTRFETFGVALAEAMASGIPTVTGDYGGFLDFLSSRFARFVRVGEDSGARVAEAVLSIITDPDLPTRREIAESATRIFDERSRANAYLGLYREAGLRAQHD
ncbi:MAG: glycosyltransferase family 4 protein [Leucobacter sp.]